ncbi:hypothetical protein C0081_00910 [Cohaesibacter celericrescens]|uniref:Uncharacterized protein n=1 Tax=Cohaesibacter celericrescens TaxID=2067669 RepID=A0A2N5XWN4_9HYPH|nr:hypothetical protein C0081_00910 [Cohaesibacter celericrescens]
MSPSANGLPLQFVRKISVLPDVVIVVKANFAYHMVNELLTPQKLYPQSAKSRHFVAHTDRQKLQNAL